MLVRITLLRNYFRSLHNGGTAIHRTLRWHRNGHCGFGLRHVRRHLQRVGAPGAGSGEGDQPAAEPPNA